MRLRVNGHEKDLSEIATIADLLTHLTIARERVAVVVNEEVIRRAQFETAQLNEGDTVEIITMVGGG